MTDARETRRQRYNTVDVKNPFKVMLVGAPCAGKTSVLRFLREMSVRWNDKNLLDFAIVTCDESWTYFQPFAQILLRFFSEGRILDRENIQHELDSQKISQCFPETVQETLELCQIVSKDDTETTLASLYTAMRLHFLDRISQIATYQDLRRLIQEELLRVQLQLEKRLSQVYSEKEHLVMIFDGGPLNIAQYPPTLALPIIQQIYRENDKFVFHLSDLLYNCVDLTLFLHTQALLPEEIISPYYFDGRRLDPPKHAREMDERMSKRLYRATQPANYQSTWIFSEREKLERKQKAAWQVVLNASCMNFYLAYPYALLPVNSSFNLES